MPSPKIIGVVGHPAAGKDSASEFFMAKGFAHISLGDFLRNEMHAKHIATDRSSIREYVKEMRALHGNQYPSDLVAKTITGDSVVSGFRNVSEVKAFLDRFGKNFYLIAINASLETRYGRIHERSRHGDDISFEKFKEEEDKERREASGSHEMDKVIEIADVHIENNGTKKELFEALSAWYNELSGT